MNISAGQTRQNLKELFQSIDEEEIEAVLEENNFDRVKSVQALTELREKKRKRGRKKIGRRNEKNCKER